MPVPRAPHSCVSASSPKKFMWPLALKLILPSSEIRHYVSRAGKDVFDDWLTQLAEAHTQAKIATRINRLAAGNFGACKSLRLGCTGYGLIGDRATECITR